MAMYFGKIYKGDSGIPHADPERYVDIWTGSFFFTAYSIANPVVEKVVSFLPHQFNWHDKAMLFEQHHWKKALKKKQPYKFKWNEHMTKEERESYYFNWPVYFP